jgi:Secretion system C-terminal sorting domain/NHL repeat
MKKLLLLLVIVPICAWGQVITTVAGNGSPNYSGDNGLAINAGIGYIPRVAFDSFGNYYFATRLHHRVRKVDTNGVITTVAGTGTAGYNGDSILATIAMINSPNGVVLDRNGNIFIADKYNNRIRRIERTTGIITTIAGTGIAGYNGDSLLATSTQLNYPQYITIDTIGNLYINDGFNNRIRKVTPAGIISTIAGNGSIGFSGDSNSATNATFNQILGICTDIAGNVYIADGGNARIRKVNVINGIITTIAGNGTAIYNGDGLLSQSTQIGAYDIVCDKANDIYIADHTNHRIRKINNSLTSINTVAGTGIAGYNGDSGLANNIQLYGPEGVSFDLCGNLYIGDAQNKRIRKVWFNTDTIPQVNIAITPNDTVITGTQVTTTATAINHGTVTGYQWVKNGANASTSSTYTYTPVNGDSVYCIVTVRACTGRMYTDTTTAIHLTVTGGAGVNSITNSIMHTYPNPVTDVLHVATTEPQHFVLHNLMGVTLLQGIVDKNYSIDMKAIPAGIYLLQLTNTQGQREVVRVVKE